MHRPVATRRLASLVSLLSIAAAIAVSTLACGTRPGTPTTPVSPGTNVLEKSPAVTATVPQGTRFRAELEDALDPDALDVGDVITARLRSPLVAPGEALVAPIESRLVGRVVLADPGTRTVGIRFEHIETLFGVFPVSARVVSADPWAVSVRPPTDVELSALLRSRSAIGGGPPASGSPDLRRPPPALGAVAPEGAVFELVLLKPFEAAPVERAR